MGSQSAVRSLKFRLFLLIPMSFLCPAFSHALDLDPYPTDRFSRENFSFSIYREERPSFYWVNTGVPDVFFNGVSQISNGLNGAILSYSIRSVEYGFHAS